MNNSNKGSVNGVYAKIQSDKEMKSCFDALPRLVQESILASGMEINNIEQLRSMADRLFSKGM